MCLFLEHFKEESYFTKLSQLARDKPGMTADQISRALNVNVVLMKELLLEAEMKGYLCRDESYEGVRYYDNMFKY